MGYSEWVSTAALALSLLVAWRTWRWERPVITIKGKQWAGGVGTVDAKKLSFSIEISNTGNHATEILSASWQIKGRGSLTEIPASHGGGGIDSLFEHPHEAQEPTYPFPLDRNQQKAWDFEMSLDTIGSLEEIRGMRPSVRFISRRRRKVVYGNWQKPNLPDRRVQRETLQIT